MPTRQDGVENRDEVYLHRTLTEANRIIMKIGRMQCFAGFSSKCLELNKDRIYEVNQVTDVNVCLLRWVNWFCGSEKKVR